MSIDLESSALIERAGNQRQCWVLRTLTVKLTVKRRDTAQNPMQINGLEGSLMIEWE